MLKMRRKTILATFLTLLLAVACVIGVFPFVASAAQGAAKGEPLTSAHAGKELSGEYYVPEGTSLTLKGGTAASGLRVKSGSTLIIHIPQGSTLTVTGGAASSTSGGGAGIEVPSTSTLMVTGEGELKATGGAGASGGNGANGETARWGDDDYSYIPDSGYGGYGGGGAGAGIGTKGGKGGSTTSWRTAFYYSRTTWTDYFLDSYYSGNSAYNGNNGKAADACGKVYIASTIDWSATKGGAAGAKGGTGGSAGSRDYESDDHDMRGLAGGSGGGGGGAGKAGAKVGTGGGGGGGGASGGGIGYAWSCYFLGAGGGGGGAGAVGGGGGAWSSDGAIPDHDCSKYTNGKEQSSYSGSTGGFDVGGDGGSGCKIKIRASKSTSASWKYPYGASGGKGGSAGAACTEKSVLTLLPITVVTGDTSALYYAYGTQFLPDTLAVATQVGYTFKGYYGEDDLQYYDESGERTEQAVSASTGVIQAKFELNNYYYSLTPTEGSTSLPEENEPVQYGSGITLPTPKREGYLFLGWQIKVANASSKLSNDAYYYSAPAPSASVYRLRNGGSANSLLYNNDGTVARTAGFEKLGDSITLFNLAAGDDDKIVFEERWMDNNFTVTFKNFDDQTISTATGEYGQVINGFDPAEISNEYYTYTFKYWKCNIDNEYYTTDALPKFGSFVSYESELGEDVVREGVVFTAVYEIEYKKEFELTGSLESDDLIYDPQSGKDVLVLKNGDVGIPVVTNFKITKNDGVSTLLLIPQYDASAFSIKAISVNGVRYWGDGALSSNVLNGFNVEITGSDQPTDVLKILLDNLTVDETTSNDVFIQIIYEMKEAIGGMYEFGFVTAALPVYTDSITHGDRSEAYAFYDPAPDSETNPFAFNELMVTIDSTAINVVIRATGVIEIPENQSFVYNSQALSALELSELIGRALQYSYNGFAMKNNDTLTIKWYADENGEIEISAPKNVGTYYIGISAKETAYYSEVLEVIQKFVITPYTVYIGANDQSFVYNGTDITIDTGAIKGGITTADGTPIEQVGGFLVNELSFDGVELLEGPYANVGVYTGKIQGVFRFIGDGVAKNYVIQYKNGTLSITQAENEWEVELEAVNREYTGSPFDVTFEALFGTADAKVQYFYGYEVLVGEDGNPLRDDEGNPLQEEIWKTEAPVNAGTYRVRVKIDETLNYSGLEAETGFVITKRVINANGLSFVADLKTYNGHQQFWTLDPNNDKNYSDAQVSMSATPEMQELLQYLQFFGVEHLSTQEYTNSGTYKILAMVQITDPNHTFVIVKDVVDEETGAVIDSVEEETNVWTYEVEAIIKKLQILVDAKDQGAEYDPDNAPNVQSGAAYLESVTLPDGTVLDFITADFFGGKVAIYTPVAGEYEEGVTYYTAEIEDGRVEYVVAEITEFEKDVVYYTLSYEDRDMRESVTLSVEDRAAYPAGSYALYAALVGDSNYELVSNEANGVFVISKKQVPVPVLSVLTYNNQKQYPQLLAEYAEIYSFIFDPDGDYENIGTYYVTVSLTEKNNYAWENIGENSSEDLILPWEIQKATVKVQLPDAKQDYVYGTNSNDFEWNGMPQWLIAPFENDEDTDIALILYSIAEQYPTVGTHNATITHVGFNANYVIEYEGGVVNILKKALTQEELNSGVSAHIKDYTGNVLVLSPAGDSDDLYDFTVALKTPNGGDVFSVIGVDTQSHKDANGKRGEPFQYYVDDEGGERKLYVIVTIALNDTLNYELADSVNDTFEIEAYIAQAQNDWDEAPAINASNNTITPSAKPIFGTDYTVTYFENADCTQPVDEEDIAYGKTYWAVFTVAEQDNYTSLSGKVEFSRTYMTVQLPVLRVDTADGPQVSAGGSYELIYDGLLHALLRGTYEANEGICYTVQITEGDWKNVGSYTVTYKLDDKYSWSDTSSREDLVYTLVIKRASLELNVDDQSTVFDTAAPTPTVTAKGLVSGELLSDLAPNIASFITTDYVEGNDCATYPVYWTDDAQAAIEQLLSNYDVTLVNGGLVVTKRVFTYAEIETGSVKLSEIIGTAGLSYVYNNVERVFGIDVIPAELIATVTYWQNDAVITGAPKNAGDYTVKIALTLKDDLNENNYEIPAEATVALKIQKAQITITVQGQSFVYDGAEEFTRLDQTPSNTTVSVAYLNVAPFEDGNAVTAITLVNGIYVDAKSYVSAISCTHTFSASNYDFTVVNGTLEITRATNKWAVDPWADSDIVYSGSDVVLADDYGATADFGNANYTFFVKSSDGTTYTKLDYVPKNAGTYYVVASVAEHTNYTQLKSDYIELVIFKKQLTLLGEGVVFDSESFIYDGEEHSLEAVFSGALALVGYSDNNSLVDVGSVTVTATFAPADPSNYEIVDTESLTAQLSVTPVKITVNIDDKTSVYGESLVPLTYTLDFTEYNPNYKDRYLAQLEGKITLSTAATSTSDVNDDGYVITGVIDDGMTNYVLVFEDGTYRITQATNSITLSAGNVKYRMPLNIVHSALHGDVILSYAIAGSDEFTATPPTTVGSYVVKAIVIGNNNYADAMSTALFEIQKAKLSKAQVTVSKDTATWEQVTTTTDGFSIDCGVTYWGDTSAYAQNSFTATSAGTFVLTAKPVDTVNYEDSDAVVLTIYEVLFDDTVSSHPKQENEADLSASEYEPQYLFAGEKVTKPQDPTIEGYRFDAWMYNDEIYDFDAGVSENMTLLTTWTIRQYTVSFYDERVEGAGVVNGVFQEGAVTQGNLIDSYTVDYGTLLAFPTLIPTKAENEAYTYTFSHYADELRGLIAVVEGGKVLGDMTLYAVYTPEGKSFEIIYNLAIDGFDYTKQWTVTAKYGDPLIETLEAVTWFTDNLWYLDEARTQKALEFVPYGGVTVYGAYVFDIGAGDVNGDGVVTTNDITLYRQWIVGGYDIVTVTAGTEWALVSDPAFDDTKLYFLERVSDANADTSGDIRDITTMRMAIVGGYGYTIAEGAAVGVSGQGIIKVDDVIQIVATSDALTNALAQGGHIQLNADIVVPLGNAITVSKETVIYLNGYDLDFSAYTAHPFEMASDAKLVIYGTTETVKAASDGLVEIFEGATNVSVILNGGNYTCEAALIKVMGDGAIAITVDNVTLTEAGSTLLDETLYTGEDLVITENGLILS